MYYVLYDKDFNALGRRKTYPCSSWSLKKKANEFDELVVEGLAIDNSEDAMYVGLHDEYMRLGDMGAFSVGSLKYIAFSGIPSTKNGKTTINAIDIRQIFNNDCVIDFTSVSTVTELYTELLTCLFDINRNGYSNIGTTILSPDVTACADILWENDSIVPEIGVGNVWKTIQAANAIYDCYIETIINLADKTIQFAVRHITETLNIKLADFGLEMVKKDCTTVNRAVCYAESEFNTRAMYYLLKDDTVKSEGTFSLNKIIYPMVVKIFEKSTLAEAKAEGIKQLFKNRFKASVEIPLDSVFAKKTLADIGLNFYLDIAEYKTLPVMEIYEDSKGTKKLKAGRLEEYWWA